MADRSISVHIKAVVTDFQRAMGQAEGSLKGFNATAKRTAEDYSSAMTTVGLAAAGAGLAIAGGLAAGVKAAVDWESSFAGVVKTVDATTEELAVLERGLRDMALEIPVSQAELAGIAEAAGQLGIQTGNILEFTETMAALGVSTNLTSEQAATMFARFANITQLPQDQIENLGSAVVDLGNNLATTEAEIIEMGLRIAGAGSQIGLTEAEILGFAGALSSVGIEAQAGGTAISRVFVEIDKAVRSGDERLSLFAETAGMSADEFTRAYQDDAAGAIVTFVEGLGRISSSGGDVFGVLESLELQDIRVRDALLRAAGAGDLFRESIDRSSTAFETNTALTEEAARRYETVASQFEIFKNTVVELGIGIGEILLPVLVPLLEGATDLVKWFSDLPAPVKTAGVVLAGVSAVLLTISGTALLLAPRILSLAAAYNTLAGAAGRAAGSMAAANAAGAAGGAAAAGRGAMLGAGAGATAAKAGAVALAGFAVFEAGKAAVDLGSDIDRQNTDLATKIAKTMLLAKQGDEQAQKGLASVRSMIDNASMFDRNVNIMSEAFIANRAWGHAVEMIEAGEVAIEDLNSAMEGSGSSAGEFEVSANRVAGSAEEAGRPLSGMAGWFDRIGRMAGTIHTELNKVAGAMGNVNQALLEATNPLFNAVSKWQEHLALLEEVDAELKDPKGVVIEEEGFRTIEEQLAVIQSKMEMGAALEALGDDYENVMDAMAIATGMPRSELEELFNELGMLDGETFTYTVKQFQVTEMSVVGGRDSPDPRFQPQLRAAGGPVVQGSMYRVGEGNLPELLKTPSGLFMVPGESGQMFSNSDSRALISALENLTGGNVSITIPSSGNPQQDAALAVTMAGLTRRVETSR